MFQGDKKYFPLRCILFFALLMTLNNSFSQIYNTDRENEDSAQSSLPIYLILSSTLKHDNQLLDYNNYNIYGEVGIKKYGHYGVLLSINADNFEVDGESIQEVGTINANFRDMDSSKLSPEILAQYHWYKTPSGYINRKMIGTNLRWQFIEKPGFDLYGGLGFAYQDEFWRFDAIPEISAELVEVLKEFKYTGYIKSSKKILDRLDVAASFSFQGNPEKMEDWESTRWNFTAQTTYDISTYFQLSLNYYYSKYEKELLLLAPVYKGYFIRLGVML